MNVNGKNTRLTLLRDETDNNLPMDEPEAWKPLDCPAQALIEGVE